MEIKNKYSATFLFDKSNNWLEAYLDIKRFKSLFKHIYFNVAFSQYHVEEQDIVFILGYTKIIKLENLNKNKLNLVVHESPLPKGRGFSPVQWQILQGFTKIPICLIEANQEVDSGDIVFKNFFEIKKHDLYDKIREKQAIATFKILEDFLSIYPNFSREKQNGKETFFNKRSKKDSELNPDLGLKKQFNLLRISNNEEWPAFFYLNGRKYIIKIYNCNDDN